MELKLTLHGLYPRSEALVKASRGLERQRIRPVEFQQVLDRDQEALFRLQQKLGCPYLESGYLNWPDRFRPLIESCQGLTPGPLTRFADTNTFFKPPVVNEPLNLNQKKLLAWFPKPPAGQWKITLPSPLHLTVASGQTSRKRLSLFGQLILEAAKALIDQGVSFIQLDDPVIGSLELTDQLTEPLADFLQELSLTKQNLSVGYYVELVDFNRAAAFLPLSVDHYGLDLFLTPIANLPDSLRGKSLIVGCIDARNSLVERPESILQALNLLEEKLAPASVLLTSSTALEFVPAPVAQRKLEILAKVVSQSQGRQAR